MKEKTDTIPKECSNSKGDRSPLNEDGHEFSRAWMGNIGTKRQTYYIYMDLIAKLQGYAYWERRKISEVVNCALDQFFEGKDIKPKPHPN